MICNLSYENLGVKNKGKEMIICLVNGFFHSTEVFFAKSLGTIRTQHT